jgi:peptidyl-prolyl cis-trans isomerase SurA
VVDLYTLRSGNESKVKEIVTMLGSGKSPEEVLTTLNKEDQQILSIQEKEYERGRDKNLDKVNWKKGAVTAALKNDRTRSTSFMVIKDIKAPGVKTLDEARGYVIADYQDFLEKKWLAELKASYKVEKNDRVFKSLIKK